MLILLGAGRVAVCQTTMVPDDDDDDRTMIRVEPVTRVAEKPERDRPYLIVLAGPNVGETYAVEGVAAKLVAGMTVTVTATDGNGAVTSFAALVRIDTPDEAEYYRHGGILQFVLRQLASA